MELYRVILQLKSSLVTPLKGDTIWGHIVWGIANHEGDNAVADFIEECKSKEPSLIVSSAFPHGTLCRPIPHVQKREKSMTAEMYAQIKKSKKSIYARAADFFAGGKDSGEEIQLNNPFGLHSVTHNSINRFTNEVLEGSLYSVSEIWSKTDLFDIYVLTSYKASRIKQLCEWAFENGYGADSSIGKGVITVLGEPEIVNPKNKTNTYMALGPFVLSENCSIQDLRADTFVRNGKIGGVFVSSLSPWKKPVVLFNEGAVFTSREAIKFAGKLITDVHSDSRICQAGFAPVIPIEES